MVADKKQESARLAKRIGARIAERRKALPWTQEQLSERVRVDAETISRFERGVNLPSLPTLDRLAKAMKVDVSYFLSASQPMPLDEATNLSALLDGLSFRDREFVIRQAAAWADHLRNRGKP